MDDNWDEAARLRRRQAGLDDDAAAPEGRSGLGVPCVVASVYHATGSTAGAFYTMELQDVSGSETEGASGVFTATGLRFKALNLGSVQPPNNTKVACQRGDYRWVFRYDG